MLLRGHWIATAIIADIPDAVERQVAQVRDYIVEAARFIGHTASSHPNEFITALSTTGIFIFTWVLAHSTKKLWRAAKDSAAQQSRDMQASIATAEESAKAANRTAQALIDAERPWVGLVTVTNVVISHPAAPYADVLIKNSGRTPARALRTRIVGHIAPQGILPPIPSTATEPPRSLIPEILDYYRPFEGFAPISQSTYQDILAGRQVVWIVGRMDYLDGGGEPHWTTMRVFWQTDGRFHPHRQDNEAT
jgi:hypothetical protein